MDGGGKVWTPATNHLRKSPKKEYLLFDPYHDIRNLMGAILELCAVIYPPQDTKVIGTTPYCIDICIYKNPINRKMT